MNGDMWIEHLSHWKAFLDARLELSLDDGDRERITRQLTALERVRSSAVLNPGLLIEFINPMPHKVSDYDGEMEFRLELNDSQREAVRSVLENEESLSLIQGPPGTGKTQVITEICLQLCHCNRNVRILVCSETHVAVNTLMKRIAEYDPTIRCLRIRDKEQNSEADTFSPKSVLKSYRNWLESACDDQEVNEILNEMTSNPEDRSQEKALALSANVVGMTCNRVGAYQFADTTEMFDYAILDEVCKATLPEILMPLIVSRKAILVGDPKQLPPVFCSEDQEVIRSIENCSLQKYMYIDDLFLHSGNAILLNTQYRMENAIGNLISRLFYDNALQNGRNLQMLDSLKWIDYEPSQAWPAQSEGDNEKPILYNLDECRIIIKILDEIERKQFAAKDVAVIVPYRLQVSTLRKMVPKYDYLRVAIDTVDGFQGKEADIVVFGITRTTGPFRFLADERRMNVALSRAKDQVIIVGYKNYAEKHSLLASIIRACKVEIVPT